MKNSLIFLVCMIQVEPCTYTDTRPTLPSCGCYNRNENSVITRIKREGSTRITRSAVQKIVLKYNTKLNLS